MLAKYQVAFYLLLWAIGIIAVMGFSGNSLGKTLLLHIPNLLVGL